MRPTFPIRSPLRALMLALSLMALPGVTAAQSPFSPAITVNDRVISHYEIDQRIKLLEVFRTPGDLAELASEQLIEDRLKLDQLARAGLQLTDEGLQLAMTEFAGRANLELDQFITVLNQNGISEETFRDYVKVGISWRDYIRSRYADRVNITEADVDLALGRAGDAAAGIEVLLSEIIIAAPPPEAARAQATAERIARLTSTAAFEAEARRVSALPSRSNGGRLDWLPLSNYPEALRGLVLSLAPGEVTPPIAITNGIALFQMRAVREVPVAPEPPVAIEYAAFYLPGGGTDAGLRDARALASRVDTCDDLYGEARGLPPERLERDSLAPEAIPQDVAFELAKLDPGEVSHALRRAGGETIVFLMLCKRETAAAQGADRDTVRNQLRGQQLAGYADALLADLRASAVIARP